MILGLAAFEAQFRKFTETVLPGQFAVLQRTIAFAILSEAVLRTRVDTGRLRGDWQISFAEFVSSTDIFDKSGVRTMNNANAKLAKLRAGDTIFISNTVYYAEVQENGNDRMAGNYMLAGALVFAGASIGL